MGRTIQLKLLDAEDIVVKELDKKHCFFVGKPGQETNALFDKAYEITHTEWPKNVFATFSVGSREFTNLSFSKGSNISKAKGSYQLRKHPDGTMYLCLNLEYSARDPYDKMYANHFQRVIYRENGEVVVIQAKYGRVLPKINVFVGLQNTVPYLEELLDILDNSHAAQMTRMKMLSRCVAQKYQLTDAVSEQMESFAVYTAMDAANISASFGVYKSKKKSLSYELLKAVTDYICGNCFEEWYQVGPKRRYDTINDLMDYIRRLKHGKHVEWNESERAFCHDVRRLVDAGVFADVYAVCLILLRFLAENDVTDIHSLMKLAGSPGVFSGTLMSETVDAFSPKYLDGEAKKTFFSLVGNEVENAKARIEQALYSYHTGSNFLFRTVHTLTMQGENFGSESDAKATESAVEKTVLSAAADAALDIRKQLESNDQNAPSRTREIVEKLCERICNRLHVNFDTQDKELAIKKCLESSALYLEKETRGILANRNRISQEFVQEFVPENKFVQVYMAACVLLRILQQAGGDPQSFAKALHESVRSEQPLFRSDELTTIVLEAKYRFGAMCGADLLEIMAELG
ncbi:MAG: hypothetical protein E7517_05575 [Ruminococcaceae bacterium]|nr:hypothetical protein [Oscillospiraceae bacterium]